MLSKPKMTDAFTPVANMARLTNMRIIFTPPDDCEVWWRADDKRYANYDPWAEFEQPSGSHLSIELRPYTVVRYTPKGVRLRGFFGSEFFVLGAATRQRAVPTIELALADLVARKKRHVQGCEQRLDEAREHLKATEICLRKIEDA